MWIGIILCCQNVILYLFSLNLTHEESREKKYEFELSWISEKTNFIHQSVPQNLIDAAVEKAVAAIEEDQMGWKLMVMSHYHNCLLLLDKQHII